MTSIDTYTAEFDKLFAPLLQQQLPMASTRDKDVPEYYILSNFSFKEPKTGKMVNLEDYANETLATNRKNMSHTYFDMVVSAASREIEDRQLPPALKDTIAQIGEKIFPMLEERK